MTNLEDFCTELAQELAILLDTKDSKPEELLKYGNANDIEFSYRRYVTESEPTDELFENGPYAELLVIKINKEPKPEIHISNYKGKVTDNDFVVQLQLPSGALPGYIAGLKIKSDLGKRFRDKLEKADKTQRNGSDFFENINLGSLSGVKELVYELLDLNTSA